MATPYSQIPAGFRRAQSLGARRGLMPMLKQGVWMLATIPGAGCGVDRLALPAYSELADGADAVCWESW